MDCKELAKELQGSQYREGFSSVLLQRAKENNLVIICGASDDIISIKGAIDDEVYGKVLFAKKGQKIEVADEDDDDWDGKFKTFSENGFIELDDETETKGNVLEGIYTEEGIWRFITEIKHETFEVYEDEELQCVGVVFNFDDLK